EMRLAREAGSNRNLRQLHIRLGDKAARSVETDIAIVKHRALPHELRKESIQLSLRQPYSLAYLRNRENVLQILFHELDGSLQDAWSGAAQWLDRARVLRGSLRAQALMKQIASGRVG